MFRSYLSNGRYAYIKILPETASAKAQEELSAKCENNNCIVELKEVGSSTNAKAAYEVEKKCKNSRVY